MNPAMFEYNICVYVLLFGVGNKKLLRIYRSKVVHLSTYRRHVLAWYHLTV